MAKAKKSTSTDGSKKTATAKKGPAKKAQAAPATSPMINTSLAAESAARMLAAKFSKPSMAGSGEPRQESAMFKQLKAGLNTSHGTTMSNLLDKSHGPDPTRTHPQMKQIGRNQTFGADVTRSGVPRRTPG